MKVLFVALAVLVVASSAAPLLSTSQYEFLFSRFAQQYQKEYEVTEIFSRFGNFKNALDIVLNHNQKNSETYTLAINEFADLTDEEFNKRMGLVTVTEEVLAQHEAEAKKSGCPMMDGTVNSSESNADSLDWRASGAVTSVKNQGSCGSCWAFSAGASAEGAWKIKSGSLVELSQQQMVDCAGSYGNHGCQGGLMTKALSWAAANGGICRASDYAYTAKDGTCKKGCTPAAKITGSRSVSGEAGLLSGLRVAPTTVAIYASDTAFRYYAGGVFNAACGTSINHGVTAVGFGTDAGKDYWIVKNSWGTSWGEQGYIRMIRNKNICGIASMPAYATA